MVISVTIKVNNSGSTKQRSFGTLRTGPFWKLSSSKLGWLSGPLQNSSYYSYWSVGKMAMTISRLDQTIDLPVFTSAWSQDSA
ncbi:Protein AIM2 [Fusarium oxysporum f. sp. albedinis]|nr:Protein AIM2 [Fusarium oxysporum f. sp. albedinis]